MSKTSISTLLRKLAKTHGEGSVALFDDLGDTTVTRVSTGLPSLDAVLGGGLPEGRIIEIYGPASSGKTTAAIKLLAEVQKKHSDKYVAFIDVEHAYDPEYAAKLGIDKSRLIFSQPDNAEQALNIMIELAESGDIAAIILDSVAQLTPKKELEGNVGDAEMAMRARLMSQSLRKLVPVAKKNNVICFFINQVRENVGQMYGNPEVRPGGKALPFAASICIRTSFKRVDDKRGETTFTINKNKVGVPFKKTTIAISYGEGFDYMSDLITTMKACGIIQRAGAYFSFGNKRWQGETAMREEILNDESLSKDMKEVWRNSVN